MADEYTLPVRVDLPQPTDAELEHLADVIDEVRRRRLAIGPATLAGVILRAGYRLVPEPKVQFGECRACTAAIALNEHGALVDHEDQRRGRPGIGAHNTPVRLAPAPEAVV